MKLKNLLLEKKSVILKKWFDVILETYPADTSNFLRNQKDRFTNPIGHTLLQGTAELFENLLNEIDSDHNTSESFLEHSAFSVDNIIRIRAVQDFTPSHAVAFILLLKNVVREELKDVLRENGIVSKSTTLWEELLTFESKIDDLALLSFNIYMKCREKIYELKANEVKNMTFGLLKRANLIFETEEPDLCLKNDNTVNTVGKVVSNGVNLK